MKRFTVALILLFISCSAVRAQNKIIAGDSLVFIEKTLKKVNKNFNFTVLPGPVYNSSNQLGFAVMPMLVYRMDKNDTLSPTSSTSALLYANFYPSWMAGIKQNFYWDRDRWRAILTIGYGHIHQKFYGIGRDTAVVHNEKFVWADEETFYFSATCYRKIVGGLYGGLEYNYSNILLTGIDSAATAEINNKGIATGRYISSLITPTFVWDNRNNIYFTTKGYYAMVNLKYSDKIFQSCRNYFVITAFLSGYHSLLPQNKRLTLAWRFYFKGTWNDVPYSEMPDYSGSDAVLGYTPGKYVNFYEVNTQAELRYDLWKFIGIAGFGGTGKVFSSPGTFGHSVWLPFGGIGVYVNVIPYQNLRMRFNVAVARDDWGFYIGLGQLF
ncbi:MAG: BamA/TamA family outer membrane protein [Bacteroidales bacterium]|nr:BamA/TamA family outer membrane protein [Bacteroidales bacterium]